MNEIVGSINLLKMRKLINLKTEYNSIIIKILDGSVHINSISNLYKIFKVKNWIMYTGTVNILKTYNFETVLKI